MFEIISHLAMMDGEGLGCLIIAGIIYAILQVILLILKYAMGAALSIITVITGLTAAAGLVFGLYYACKCFFMAFFQMRDNVGIWKRTVKVSQELASNNAAYSYTGRGIRQYDYNILINPVSNKPEFYEAYISPEYSSYFHGVFVKETKMLLSNNFSNITNTIGACWKNVSDAPIIIKALSFLKNLITVVLLIVSAIIVTAFVGIAVTLVWLISMFFYWTVYAIVTVADRMYYASHKLETHCTNPKCKKVFRIPVYCCPQCETPHRSLRPGRWGILHRKCACGLMLPCTVHGKTKGAKLTKANFEAFCPECSQRVSNQSRPLGVALLGGVNSGKSTFKTAFLYHFIEETAVLNGADIELADSQTQLDYRNIKNYFIGRDFVPETRPDKVRGYDVTSFNFYINHKKFTDRRMVQMYDMPGEIFETGSNINPMSHLTYVEGLVFLLDPYSLQSVAGAANHSGMRIGMMDINTLVKDLLTQLRKVPNMQMHNKKFTIPVAVCINKVDTPSLRQRIGLQAAKELMNKHPDRFSSEFDALDYLCRAFMEVNMKGNAVMMIDQNFETVHYFSCTSMGHIPTNSRNIRFQPENVSAAVSWIFSRADKQFDKVFKEYDIKDVTEAQKELGRKDLSFYRELESELPEMQLIASGK